MSLKTAAANSWNQVLSIVSRDASFYANLVRATKGNECKLIAISETLKWSVLANERLNHKPQTLRRRQSQPFACQALATRPAPVRSVNIFVSFACHRTHFSLTDSPQEFYYATHRLLLSSIRTIGRRISG